MFIKLFEQWIAEETQDAKLNIRIESYEAGDFNIIAVEDNKVESQFSKSYKVVSSSNPNIKEGAVVMVSPIVDKEGDFEMMVVNDPATGQDLLNYSGKVDITQITGFSK